MVLSNLSSRVESSPMSIFVSHYKTLFNLYISIVKFTLWELMALLNSIRERSGNGLNCYDTVTNFLEFVTVS